MQELAKERKTTKKGPGIHYVFTVEACYCEIKQPAFALQFLVRPRLCSATSPASRNSSATELLSPQESGKPQVTTDPSALVAQWLENNYEVSDDCQLVDVTYDYTPTALDVCTASTTVVTWTATDACGNSSIVTANLIINPDVTAPLSQAYPTGPEPTIRVMDSARNA